MQKKFSFPIEVADLPQNEHHYKISATAENCDELREILQVPAVKSVEADIRLKNNHSSGLIDVWGHITAVLDLESVVSLELFEQKYDFDFSYLFDVNATYAGQKEDAEDWTVDLPDVVIGGKIDLADLIIEQIALRIDDYPRKEGEVFLFEAEFDDDEPKNNPFDVLSKLKK